jgi:2-keto-4-pentenoate hydratase/2-oxohepta-3-ene-1,7-dioic acid hydratase in catechol pathway
MTKDLEYYLEKTTKIIGVGANYVSYVQKNHLEIPEKPILFLKPTTSIIRTNQNIIYPQQTKQLEFEAELGIVIKNKCRNLTTDNWKEYVAGYTCVNDVTARDLQPSGTQWTESKSFDGFCPIGPTIKIIDTNNLKIRCFVNDECKQYDNTNNMIFNIEKLMIYITSIMTLNEGDVISTGTPSGSCPVNRGDKIVIEIDHIGELINIIE